jgi:tetratricopeptide (TPR) repeat protein|tara:strand:+ start:1504 stop:1824 length:321 start_codon:yes stop_codon:yes gene_type:complete
MSSNARIEQIKTFLNETPEDAFLLYALATEHVSLGNDDEALLLYLNLVAKQPDYFATYYHLGKLYERISEDDEAEKIYEQGLAVTKRLGQKHAHGELRGAYEELTF